MKGTIVYLGGFILPDKNAAAHRVLANAKIFTSLGYRVVLIGVSTETLSGNYEKHSELHHNIEMYSIRYPKTTRDWVKFLYETNNVKSILSKYLDVKYAVFYNYPALAFLRLIRHVDRNKTKIISDCTEWYMDSKGPFLKKIVKKTDTLLRMKYIHKKSVDGMIVISKFLEDYYAGIPLIHIPPLVDLEEAKWHRSIDFSTPARKLKFIYAGQIGEVKDNIFEVIKVFSEIDKEKPGLFTFEIIGLQKEEFQRLAGDTIPNLDEFITFYGRKSHEFVVGKVMQSDFVIFFRDNNLVNEAGFPTKFVEAMSCGVPVVTNLTSNISKYLNDGSNGFVIDNPKDNIATKTRLMEIMSTDEIVLKQMKEASRECSVRNFDYRDYVARFEHFFSELSSGNGRK